MRLAIFVCGFALISGPAFGQQSGLMMEAPPQPVLMPSAPKVASQGGVETQKQVDTQLNRQVNVTQQRLQQEEARLQSQFAKLQQMRAAALKKQDKKELDRIEQLEQQVVADYQKRVEQVLVSAQAQIQATPIHVRGSQPQQQPAKPAAAKSKLTRSRSAQTQQSRSQSSKSRYNRSRSTAPTNAQSQQQQTRKPSQSKQQTSSSRYRKYRR